VWDLVGRFKRARRDSVRSIRFRRDFLFTFRPALERKGEAFESNKIKKKDDKTRS
jgi:hypothetical protein